MAEVGAKVGRIYHGELKVGETTTKVSPMVRDVAASYNMPQIAIKVCYRNIQHGEKVAEHAHVCTIIPRLHLD